MGKIATKKATKELQKIFDFLGEFGGIIETNDPGIWWKMDVEVEHADKNMKKVLIGVCKTKNGDVIFDPQFKLSLKMEHEKIIETEIIGYISQLWTGEFVIDEDDYMHWCGTKEKDEYGLKRRFSSFMDNMVVNAPYLTNPKTVTKYNATLEHSND